MPRTAEYKLFIKGLLTELRTSKSAYLKKMLVSPDWIELWYLVTENKFDLALWSNLNQLERNWMIELAQKLKVDNKVLNIQHNKEASKYIEEIQLIEGSIQAGNNSPELIDKFYAILEVLRERNMIHAWTVNAMKKNFNRILEQKKSIDKVLGESSLI